MTDNPPFYIKHKNPAVVGKGEWSFDGPFTSQGDALLHVERAEYRAKHIQWEMASRAEYLEWSKQPEDVSTSYVTFSNASSIDMTPADIDKLAQLAASPKRGPGRPKKTELGNPEE